MSNITKKQKIRKIVGMSIAVPMIAATIFGLAYGNHLAFNVYPNNLTEFFKNADDADNESIAIAKAKGNELSREIVREGSVLVRNENDTLPLDKSITKVNVFGYNSVDWFYSGSGSGEVRSNGEVQYNICTALEYSGIEYNRELYNFYLNYRVPTGVSNPGTLFSTAEEFAVLVEPPLTDPLKNNAKNFSKTAIVSIGRKGGESEDSPHVQYKYNGSPDTSKGYLEASNEEIELLTYVGSNFDNVIVVINSTNIMQLDFLETIPGIDSCLIVGCTGNFGATGIYDLLYGDYSPSAKLSDTYARNLKYNPTYFHGTYENTGTYKDANSNAWPYNRNYKRGQEKTVFYSDYVEGIYVGYKWFETADAEHYWDTAPYNGYKNVVQYPFGYGLSYTTFDWELESISLPNGSELTDTKQKIIVKVKVTNTGDKPGKDVVEVYMTPPYIDGGIEKAHVNLVGFEKTQTLNPNDSQTLEIRINISDFESYDCYDKNGNNHVGYELDRGDYELKFMSDAHTLKEGMANNVITYHVNDTINIDEDEVTGQKVTNLFTGENAVDGISIDGNNAEQNIQYFSRQEFPHLPTLRQNDRTWNVILEVSRENSACVNAYSVQKASEWDNKTGLDPFGKEIKTTKPTWGAGGNQKVLEGNIFTDLGKKLANPANWDSTDWDSLLNQISFDEAISIINDNALANSTGISSVGRPNGSDADGPQQIGSVAGLGGVQGTAYPSGTVMGQTWSKSLCYSMGKSYGADMQTVQRSGAYAFGCNIHRNAYAGRNFEYYSEDAFLSGQCALNATKGVQVNGKYLYMKHFAVNDQEFHRVGLYTWLTEQALREIYLRPFKDCVIEGGISAIMSSFNRVGATWAGGSEALLTGVLRNEWQFHGMVITDYCESWEYMDQSQAIRAGSNYGMSMNYTYGSASSVPTLSNASPRLQWRLREICKETIYGYIHPLLVNANYNESDDVDEYIITTTSKKPWEFWRPMIVSIDIVVGSALLFWAYIAFRPIPDPKVNEEDNDEKKVS